MMPAIEATFTIYSIENALPYNSEQVREIMICADS